MEKFVEEYQLLFPALTLRTSFLFHERLVCMYQQEVIVDTVHVLSHQCLTSKMKKLQDQKHQEYARKLLLKDKLMYLRT